MTVNKDLKKRVCKRKRPIAADGAVGLFKAAGLVSAFSGEVLTKMPDTLALIRITYRTKRSGIYLRSAQ